MGNVNVGNVSEVIVGPVKLMVAPIGSDEPTLTADEVVWPEEWTNPGYTQDGLQMTYAPTIVDIMVDEEANPIEELLDREKIEILAKLAQGTLKNLHLGISGSKLTVGSPTATEVGTETLEVGGGALEEIMVGFEGKSPAGFWRVMIGYRANVKANLSLAFKRTGTMIIPVTFGLLADSTKTPGANAFKIVDKMLPMAGAGARGENGKQPIREVVETMEKREKAEKAAAPKVVR